MAITKRTVLDQTTIDEETGTIMLRFKKIIEEDGVPLTEPQYHRTVIEPGMDVDAHMAVVNAHVQGPEIKAGPIEAASLSKIRTRAQQEHTPQRITEFRARKKAEEDRRRILFPGANRP